MVVSSPMSSRRALPAVLTIAGSDSGGGAGIQADLKTFAALGVHGTCAITCITAQNPKEVTAIQGATPNLVQAQILTVLEELPPAAIKTGMLYSNAIIRAVADALKDHTLPPMVVDPVMVATSGACLLKPNAIRTLTELLFPLATLITPNRDEAALLLQRELNEVEDLRQAARDLHARFGCAVLVKGGHLKGLKSAIDCLYSPKAELLIEAPFIRGIHTHGTGCTTAAAIAAFLAQGQSLAKAVENAKNYVSRAIAQSRRVCGHDVLGFMPNS
jgi:hydroxymethylpyrimidine/phosphomethylpyrimidine kinase